MSSPVPHELENWAHATDVTKHVFPRHQTDKPPETIRVCLPGKAERKGGIRARQDAGNPIPAQG